ncbi:hypothetical protein SEA_IWOKEUPLIKEDIS_88 [Mycobacterium phage Iwokeuplikedis]|nr:hypothetical protein SEA_IWOKEUPLIKEDIS_88 [Mycobacterium phage Iwokeuplikedis]
MLSDWVRALREAGIDVDILNWVPNGDTATRRELLEAGELTIEDLIANELEGTE